MSRHMVRIAVVLLLACSALASSAGATRAWDEPTLVATTGNAVSITRLRTDGRFVIWIVYSSQSPGSTTATLDGIDRLTGEPVSVDISGDPENPSTLWDALAVDLDIDGGLLALSTTWNHYHGEGPHGVFAKNLYTGEQWQLSSANVPGPVGVSGSTVYWVERIPGGGDHDVIRAQGAYPGADTSNLYTAATWETFVKDLSVAEGHVIWQEHDEATDSWRLATLAAGDDLTIAEGTQRIPFDARGDVLVYREAGGLSVRSLTTGVTRHIAIDATQFATDGRYIVWNANPLIRMYDLQTDASFVAVTSNIVDGAGGQFGLVAASGGALSWTRTFPYVYPPPYDQVTNEIHAAPISTRLPSAPRPNPDAIGATWKYFPETSHYLSWSFLEYWQANGGLPVFGFPLTEEFSELNADTGVDYTIQLTERQRFEYHPENAPPYHVLLGRLGAELLVSQGRDWTTFPTADPSAPHYMPATGHAIDERFWDYWSGRGLDVGDPGVSFRESLALFGYPLSEPMMETNADNDTVLTQYFERAVFEWHPDNPPEWRVLLRRLGAEALSDRGW